MKRKDCATGEEVRASIICGGVMCTWEDEIIKRGLKAGRGRGVGGGGHGEEEGWSSMGRRVEGNGLKAMLKESKGCENSTDRRSERGRLGEEHAFINPHKTLPGKSTLACTRQSRVRPRQMRTDAIASPAPLVPPLASRHLRQPMIAHHECPTLEAYSVSRLLRP